MGSRDDLVLLRALIRSEREIAEGLDEYCVLVAEANDAGVWVDAPPRVGRVFAEDGTEHEFCLLENGAVLLYTPLSDTPYRVVGRDLREFLGLLLHGNGTHIGALGYEWEAVIDELIDGPDAAETTDSERQALTALTDALDLVRWPDLRTRLNQLQALLPAACAPVITSRYQSSPATRDASRERLDREPDDPRSWRRRRTRWRAGRP